MALEKITEAEKDKLIKSLLGVLEQFPTALGNLLDDENMRLVAKFQGDEDLFDAYNPKEET